MGVNNTIYNDMSPVINELYEQATGRKAIGNVDTGDIVAACKHSVTGGVNPALNALMNMVTRTVVDSRNYSGMYRGLMTDVETYGNIIQKVDFGKLGVESDEAYNLQDGKSVDQWKVRKPKVYTTYIENSNTMAYHLSTLTDQYNTAMRSASDLRAFLSGVMVKVQNEFEVNREDMCRSAVANFIASVVDAKATGQIVHLLTEYKAYTGDSTLTPESVLQQANYIPFMQWVFGRFNIVTGQMGEYGTLNHFNPVDFPIDRHTPKNRLKVYMSKTVEEYFNSRVKANTRNPSFLEIADCEYIPYWQSPKDGARDKIMVTPQYFDVATGGIKTAEKPVTVDKIMGVAFDDEAIKATIRNEEVYTTPINASGKYYNTWWHWNKAYMNQFTENFKLFLLD